MVSSSLVLARALALTPPLLHAITHHGWRRGLLVMALSGPC